MKQSVSLPKSSGGAGSLAMETTPQSGSRGWYRSSGAIVLASILLPPLGLLLLWLRKDIETGKKVFGSLAILALSAAYILLLIDGSIFSASPDPASEAHYAALEKQRAEQRRAAAAPTPLQPPQAANPDSPASADATALPSNEGSAAPANKVVARNYWTNYRGPGRDGRYDESTIRTDWPSSGLPLLWKQPIGGGYASFVVADGMAFTIEQRRQQEVAAAYDLETGRELWTYGWNAEFRESMGGDGPRATPTWDAGRVYALGAQGDLKCLEAKTGKLIWSKNILRDNGADNLPWGMAASPLIVDDKVIVLPGGTSDRSVVAYNKLTGAPIWRSLGDKASYASPMLVTLAGKQQLLVITASRVVGLNPGDGTLLWEHPWKTYQGITAAQPIIVDATHFFISAGYGQGAALIEINDTSEGLMAKSVWENNSMKNKFNSSVIFEGYVYGLDEGILTCVDVKTGERKWKGGRYGYGQLMLAGSNLMVTTDDGEVVLLKATPLAQTELARFPAIEGKTWNCPAISAGRLLVRNETQMACFDIRSH
jgi:outer membrane protein assembly factor BamB